MNPDEAMNPLVALGLMLGAMMACDRLPLHRRERAVLRVHAALKQG